MEIILISQIIYTQLTNNAYIRLQQLMRNPNPTTGMKRITEGEVNNIIGQPKNCTETQTIKTCNWKEKDRTIEIVYNLKNTTISRWTSRGF